MPNPRPYPNLIAICGYPNSGKSAVQRIMNDLYHVIPVDDGKPLREMAKTAFGLTDWHVYTQDGKASTVILGDNAWTVRNILGTIGKGLEGEFGEEIIGEMAINSISPVPGYIYSFGSVRKVQGNAYRRRGGIVVEVVRDGCEPKYDFDHYEKAYVNFTIKNENVEDWYERLQTAVRTILGPIHAIAFTHRGLSTQKASGRVDVI